MAKDVVYVVGHKSPDTDSVCSAIALADYLKKQKRINASPAAAGDLNPETKFVLEFFKIKAPLKLESAADKTLILVDHSGKHESPDGIENARILRVLDHHKISFELGYPIEFATEPVGATATLVAKIMLSDKKYKITPAMAGILVSAILSDTVVFKSSTATKTDIETARILAKKARIKDLKKFGIEIKKQKASLKGLDAAQIIRSDVKEFEVSGKKFAIGQIEAVDLREAKERKAEILEALDEIRRASGCEFAVLMATDIIKGGSEVMIAGNAEYLERAFGKKIQNGSVYIPKMMSRKKDLLPPLMKALK